jgi:hypothetical protein
MRQDRFKYFNNLLLLHIIDIKRDIIDNLDINIKIIDERRIFQSRRSYEFNIMHNIYYAYYYYVIINHGL